MTGEGLGNAPHGAKDARQVGDVAGSVAADSGAVAVVDAQQGDINAQIVNSALRRLPVIERNAVAGKLAVLENLRGHCSAQRAVIGRLQDDRAHMQCREEELKAALNKIVAFVGSEREAVEARDPARYVQRILNVVAFANATAKAAILAAREP